MIVSDSYGIRIISTHSYIGIDTASVSERDERTGLNAPLVYQLWYQLKRWVAMCGRDKR